MQIELKKHYFTTSENNLISYGKLSASLFTYSTGVEGIRISNAVGNVELLPFKGQQIWRAFFHGRELSMKTAFQSPPATTNFLQSFGAFMVHCGASRIGGPEPGESFPIHGHLPNATYEKVYLIGGSDSKGNYLALSGEYRFIEFFGNQYLAHPEVKIYENSGLMDIRMAITNLAQTDFELMYLCHINFRPINGAQLHYTAPYDAKHVRVRTSVPSHIKPPTGYAEFLDSLAQNPSLHHTIRETDSYDPEAVFYIQYSPDANGFCHTLQVHASGEADYVCHHHQNLPCALRWISRTPNHDAIALVEPSTCEADGYANEKEKGNIRIVKPGETYTMQISAGALNVDELKNITSMNQIIVF